MNSKTKLGLFYFPNDRHYHRKERERWLSELLSLGVNWLVLSGESRIAIPEPFIQALLENEISPIIRLTQIPLEQKPTPEFELIVRTYSSWGVQYLQLFDRPNTRSFWGSKAWVSGNLVEHFIDLFLPYAELLIKYNLRPIFPPLEVAREFWDTAFLRLALESLLRRRQTWLLERLILSAYVHLYEAHKPLTWGAGGQERYPNIKPYQAFPNCQDHRGLYIADWYETIARAALGKPLPIILLDDPAYKPLNLTAEEIQKRTLRAVQRLLDRRENEMIEIDGEAYEPLAAEILCLNFYGLANENSESDPRAWFQYPDQPQMIVEKVREYWLNQGNLDLKAVKTPHVLLLPRLTAAQLHTLLEKLQPFLIQYQPQLVFSLTEAYQAEHVWFLADITQLTETEVTELVNHACILHPIDLDGTRIASQPIEPSLEVL